MVALPGMPHRWCDEIVVRIRQGDHLPHTQIEAPLTVVAVHAIQPALIGPHVPDGVPLLLLS